MYHCVIIDDEQHAIDGLKSYIESVPELQLVASYSDSLEALKKIMESDRVDLIFLDVDMPKINGIELSKEIRSKTDKLVFTTAHTKYAYDAFEVNADAFLLKPYTLGKFVITVNKLFPEKKTVTETKSDDFFFVKSKEENLKIIKVKFEDIVAIESKLNYIMIHLKHKNVVTYLSLSESAKLLQHIPDFVQLHRSFIVRKSEIESVDGNEIRLSNKVRLTVGENYRKAFNAFVADRLLKAGKRV